jgi:hypothetical protein
MKIRIGFVSNSSSSSFIINDNKHTLTTTQVMKRFVEAHTQDSSNYCDDSYIKRVIKNAKRIVKWLEENWWKLL